MYARRYSDGPRFRPASLGAALAINGGVIAALLLANPELVPGIKPTPPLVLVDVVEPPKPPPPVSPKSEKVAPRTDPGPTVVTPTRQIETDTWTDNTLSGGPIAGETPGTGVGVDPIPPIEITPPPPFIGAREDPRYLSQFQPPYPDQERDAGREDVVRLRVLIGVDGRVKQVERLAGSDSFARAATAHALAKWRFKPATRGGVPEESWRVMTVRFTLKE